MIKLRILAPSLLLLLPVFAYGYGSIKGTSLGEFSSCDYYLIEDSYGDYTLAEWYGGNTPDAGDVMYGELHSYGFKDLYNLTADSETRTWIDDYLLSEDSAAEKLIDKCGYDKSISSYFDYDYGYSYPTTYTQPSSPTCPLNSYAFGNDCKCNQGYVVNNDKSACVPQAQVNLCVAGGILNSHQEGNFCKCDAGFFQSTKTNKCVVISEFCADALGVGGISVGETDCGCKTGYTLIGKQCIANTPVNTQPTATTAPKPSYIAPTITKKVETPKISNTVSTTSTATIINDQASTSTSSEKNIGNTLIIQKIKNFFSKMFGIKK